MCLDQPKHWYKWLSLVEWWYNTNYHSSIHTTPFEVVYGQPPPIHLPYLLGSFSTLTVDRSLLAKEEEIKLLKFHLLRAQNRTTQEANKHRTYRVFAIGNYVYLKFHPCRKISMKSHGFHELLPKFYGPFLVEDHIGSINYLHVSQLKLCRSPQVQPVQHLAPVNHTSRISITIFGQKDGQAKMHGSHQGLGSMERSSS